MQRFIYFLQLTAKEKVFFVASCKCCQQRPRLRWVLFLCSVLCLVRVPKGFRAPGLRTQNSEAPELRTKINKAPELPRNWPRAPGSAMLFCFNPKANCRIEKIQKFLFFKRCFCKFFPTPLMFHRYLELFINHDQWMRLMFDTVNDVPGFEG